MIEHCKFLGGGERDFFLGSLVRTDFFTRLSSPLPTVPVFRTVLSCDLLCSPGPAAQLGLRLLLLESSSFLPTPPSPSPLFRIKVWRWEISTNISRASPPLISPTLIPLSHSEETGGLFLSSVAEHSSRSRSRSSKQDYHGSATIP